MRTLHFLLVSLKVKTLAPDYSSINWITADTELRLMNNFDQV